MENKGGRRRQTCPHCSQNLSYSAFLAHKARYFNEVSLQWTVVDSSGSTKRSGNVLITHDVTDADAQVSEQTSFNKMMMKSEQLLPYAGTSADRENSLSSMEEDCDKSGNESVEDTLSPSPELSDIYSRPG